MAKYLEAKINYDNYDKHVIRTVEAHTEGEYCRVALDCPELPGNTMIEKKHYLEEHYDYLRTMLMFEPRGHHDMFGAFLCEPINPEADFGVFFMDGGGYLNMLSSRRLQALSVLTAHARTERLRVLSSPMFRHSFTRKTANSNIRARRSYLTSASAVHSLLLLTQKRTSDSRSLLSTQSSSQSGQASLFRRSTRQFLSSILSSTSQA